MDYRDIENKYIKAKIKGHYRFTDALEVKEVLGYDFRAIRGFNDLSDDDKTLAEKLICNFINGNGLEARERIIPTKITRERGKFTVTFSDKRYSYLYDSGTIG